MTSEAAPLQHLALLTRWALEVTDSCLIQAGAASWRTSRENLATHELEVEFLLGAQFITVPRQKRWGMPGSPWMGWAGEGEATCHLSLWPALPSQTVSKSRIHLLV